MTNDDFIKLMFADAPAGAFPWVTAFQSAPGDASRGEWGGWPVRRLSDVPSTGNTYVVVSSFVASEGRHRRRKANFAAMHTVMFDDIGTKIPERSIALPFTVLVETSPGNCQGWLKLNPPIADRDLAERLVNRMIDAGLTANGKDSGMKGVTRYGRLPQGRNTKPRPSGAWLHRVIEARTDLTYTVDEIAEAYELDLTAPPPQPVRPPPPGPLPDVLGWLVSAGRYQAPLGGGWHAITCPWVNEHTDGIASGTAYREPATDNHGWGAFKCHHGHCEKRHIKQLLHLYAMTAGEVKA
jgi:hypothetical protein